MPSTPPKDTPALERLAWEGALNEAVGEMLQGYAEKAPQMSANDRAWVADKVRTIATSMNRAADKLRAIATRMNRAAEAL